MSDTVTLYRPEPDEPGHEAPYIGGLHRDGTVTVDGDVRPVEFRTVSWCTTHDSSVPFPGRDECGYVWIGVGKANKPEIVDEECVFTDKLVEV